MMQLLAPERNLSSPGPMLPFTGLQEFIHDLLCVYLIGPFPVGCNNDTK